MQEDKAMLEVDESPLFPTLEESDPAQDMNDPLQELTCLLGLCEPVSYTHLDVYKRQVRRQRWFVLLTVKRMDWRCGCAATSASSVAGLRTH